MKRLLILLASQSVAFALLIAGCTTVQNPDGTSSRVLGFDSPEAQATAQAAVDRASSRLPFPFGDIVGAVGTLVVAAVGVYAAKKKGEDIGWDTAHTESPALGGVTPKPADPAAPKS